MDNIDDLLSEDMENLAPGADSLKTLSALCARQLQLESDIALLEEQLKQKNKEFNKISGEEIPALMSACGLESFVLENGAKVTTKPDVSMTLGEAVKPKVIVWLKENNHGDIVSNEITVVIPKGTDAKKVQAVCNAAAQSGLIYSQQENVNTATVKSLYKDLRERGVSLNPQDFGAHHYTKTTIKLPVPKKPRATRN